MARDSAPPTREERLAAKLRENLHRRKAQARTQAGQPRDTEAKNEPGALPKTPPKS